jgi:hypothetical protein
LNGESEFFCFRNNLRSNKKARFPMLEQRGFLREANSVRHLQNGKRAGFGNLVGARDRQGLA